MNPTLLSNKKSITNYMTNPNYYPSFCVLPCVFQVSKPPRCRTSYCLPQLNDDHYTHALSRRCANSNSVHGTLLSFCRFERLYFINAMLPVHSRPQYFITALLNGEEATLFETITRHSFRSFTSVPGKQVRRALIAPHGKRLDTTTRSGGSPTLGAT